MEFWWKDVLVNHTYVVVFGNSFGGRIGRGFDVKQDRLSLCASA